MHIAFTGFLTAIQCGSAPSIWFGRKQPGNFQGTLSPSVMELSRFLELAQSSRVLSPSWLPPWGAPLPMFLESAQRHQLPTFKAPPPGLETWYTCTSRLERFPAASTWCSGPFGRYPWVRWWNDPPSQLALPQKVRKPQFPETPPFRVNQDSLPNQHSSCVLLQIGSLASETL